MNENNKKLGYVRLSIDEAGSHSVNNQVADLKALDPNIQLFIDRGVSGATNLTDPKAAWAQLWAEFLLDPAHTTICVVAFDRIGRRQGKVLSIVEDIIDAGGEIHLARDNKTYNKLNETTSQDVELMFSSFTSSQYRKEVQLKTQRAIDQLKQADIKLGAPPKFTDKDAAEMRKLHERGLGYVAIGKVITKPNKDGVEKMTSPRVVRKIITGEYTTREQWERHNERKRLELRLSLQG